MDPFKILGIDRNASDEEVKRAYRAKASKYHPDAGGDAWVFQQVQEAYESILGERSSKASGQNAATRQTSSASSHERKSQPQSSKSRDRQRQSSSQTHSENAQATNRPSEQPTKPNPSPSDPVGSKLVGGTWNIFFKELPLQNETNVFILVNVIDIFVTYVILRFGGQEVNPIANFFIRHWNVPGMIAFKMTVVAFVTILVQIIARRNALLASRVLNLGTVVVTLVILYSMNLVLRKIL